MFYNSKRKMAVMVSEGPMIIKIAQTMKKKKKLLNSFNIIKTRTGGPLEPIYLHNTQGQLKFNGQISIFLYNTLRFTTFS